MVTMSRIVFNHNKISTDEDVVQKFIFHTIITPLFHSNFNNRSIEVK